MAGCLSDYGTCKGISITDSWRRAQKNGKTDEKEGGQYYWDKETNLFWTWDTPELIGEKFKDIVEAKKIGGVMAWSLGEDTDKFAHLDAMQNGIKSATTEQDTNGIKKPVMGGMKKPVQKGAMKKAIKGAKMGAKKGAKTMAKMGAHQQV